ncbi:hypothetical protein Pan258_54670 [Symmachiella dynata]|nr:hypothetical protein Pan258_54670 [Symmachiella dynata]
MAGTTETAASCAYGTPIAVGNRCHPIIVSPSGEMQYAAKGEGRGEGFRTALAASRPSESRVMGHRRSWGTHRNNPAQLANDRETSNR